MLFKEPEGILKDVIEIIGFFLVLFERGGLRRDRYIRYNMNNNTSIIPTHTYIHKRAHTSDGFVRPSPFPRLSNGRMAYVTTNANDR